MPLKCGLLGEKLAHSMSPAVHAKLGDYEYVLYEKTKDEVERFLLDGEWDVLNVTIPYKKTACRLCGELSDVAAMLDNVNVVVRLADGTIYGDNTDFAGFVRLVDELGVSVSGRKCLVLGTGGAGDTARFALKKLQAGSVVMISRRGENNYANISRHSDAEIIVNATPVGMFPNVDESPVSLDDFPKCKGVIDLIYNPSPTKLLSQASAKGIAHAGGMTMLEEQARLSSVYMNANIYFYGPPGSGKSTLAKKLAALRSMPLVDLDSEIERREGRSIADIFRQDGEIAFRKVEKAVFAEIAEKRGTVVALGGGTLLDEASRRLAEATGRVILLECGEDELFRRISLSSARPLLEGDKISKFKLLLQNRRSHYDTFKERSSGTALSFFNRDRACH